MSNYAVLLGRLTRDPELKYSRSGNAMATFTLAVDRPLSKEKKKEEEAAGRPTADFIRCIAYGARAETLQKFVGKGDRLQVEGSIRTGSYEDRDGKRVYTTDVLVNDFTFIDSSRKSNQAQRLHADDFMKDVTFIDSSRKSNQVQQQEPDDFMKDFTPIDDDRIPF